MPSAAVSYLLTKLISVSETLINMGNKMTNASQLHHSHSDQTNYDWMMSDTSETLLPSRQVFLYKSLSLWFNSPVTLDFFFVKELCFMLWLWCVDPKLNKERINMRVCCILYNINKTIYARKTTKNNNRTMTMTLYMIFIIFGRFYLIHSKMYPLFPKAWSVEATFLYYHETKVKND